MGSNVYIFIDGHFTLKYQKLAPIYIKVTK